MSLKMVTLICQDLYVLQYNKATRQLKQGKSGNRVEKW